MEVTAADLEGLAPILGEGFGVKTPNLVTHVYKNRRGKWNRVKVWSYADMGNVRVEDLFVTDNDYKLIPFEVINIECYNEETEEIEVDRLETDYKVDTSTEELLENMTEREIQF